MSVATFLVVAWPILAAYSRGSNSGHVALLGLMSSFDGPLGVQGSIYDWGYFYNDGFANRTVNSFTYRREGHPVVYISAEYDRAMVVLLLTIARHWPADMVARAYGAALKVFEEPFTVGVYQNAIPYGIHHPTVVALYEKQMSVLRALNGIGAAAVALTRLEMGSAGLGSAGLGSAALDSTALDSEGLASTGLISIGLDSDSVASASAGRARGKGLADNAAAGTATDEPNIGAGWRPACRKSALVTMALTAAKASPPAITSFGLCIRTRIANPRSASTATAFALRRRRRRGISSSLAICLGTFLHLRGLIV